MSLPTLLLFILYDGSSPFHWATLCLSASYPSSCAGLLLINSRCGVLGRDNPVDTKLSRFELRDVSAKENLSERPLSGVGGREVMEALESTR